MVAYKHVQLSILLFITLCNAPVLPADLSDDFVVAPRDKVFYYGKKQDLVQVCVPPKGSRLVAWRRENTTFKESNNKQVVFTTLQNDQRVSIFTSSDVEKYISNPLKLISEVHVLEIKSVLPGDQGAYKCVTSVKYGNQGRFLQREANFSVVFTQDCDGKYFKCSTEDESCIVKSNVCDGYSDCKDGSDEAASAGCSVPVTTVAPTPTYNIVAAETVGIGISVRWTRVQGAQSYQIRIGFPDGSNETKSVFLPEFKLENVLPNAIYSFQVRQWTGLKYGKFTKNLLLKTMPIKLTPKPMEISIDANQTLTISWDYTFRKEAGTSGQANRTYGLKYALQTCRWESNIVEWKSNETLVSDVKVLGCFNESLNKTMKICDYKNYTIHYEKKHEIDNMKKGNCQITHPSSKLHFEFQNLKTNDIYFYKVMIYQSGRIVGDYSRGNFTVPEYIPSVPQGPIELLTGVEIYGIACGILLVLLAISFVLAYYFEWEKLMNDIELKRAKMENDARQAEMDRVRPELLVGSYINDRTNTPLQTDRGLTPLQNERGLTPLMGQQRGVTQLQI